MGHSAEEEIQNSEFYSFCASCIIHDGGRCHLDRFQRRIPETTPTTLTTLITHFRITWTDRKFRWLSTVLQFSSLSDAGPVTRE